MSRLTRIASDVLVSPATWGGSQNSLGARWVERVVDNAPQADRERAAEMVDLVTGSGFADVVARPLSGSVTIPGDDIPNQPLLTARRACAVVPEMTTVT
jgi:hypothetical protein